MKKELDKNFLKLHRLGLVRPFAMISRALRTRILKNAGYNINLIPKELIYIDLVTDSLMHSVLPQSASFNRSRVESSYLALGHTFEKHFGYKYSLPVAQGRMAEIILAKIMVKNAMAVPSNMLFITTRIHQELNGATVIEIPVKEAYELNNDFPFKGNMDTEKLERAISEYGKDWIPYIYVETCVNASGGHPVSMGNIKDISRIARQHNIPVILDSCRILENACLIKEREKGYSHKSVAEIVREFCSYTEGCTMSATKDFFVDAGGFIATNTEELYYEAQDMIMAFGSGLSVRGKAALNDVINKTFGNEKRAISRVKIVQHLWNSLKRYGLPVISPAGGHAVFIDAKALCNTLPEEYNPEKAFLVHLYLTSGIRAGEHILTPYQKKTGYKILRFAVPPLVYSKRHMDYVARELVKAWKNPSQIRGLKKIHQPPSLSGAFFAQFEPRSPN